MKQMLVSKHVQGHESSVGPPPTANPKPRGKPSHCLLRRTYVRMSTQQKGGATYVHINFLLSMIAPYMSASCLKLCGV